MKKRTVKDLSASEIDRIVHLSYGNSAPVIADMYGTSANTIRRILRRELGRMTPWGERRK